jgi:hypothetical protein
VPGRRHRVGDRRGRGKPGDPAREADDLYAKLEHVVAPLFYVRPLAFAEVMRSAIALNGSYYNAQRMVAQYLRNAYASSAEAGGRSPDSPEIPDVAHRTGK